MGWGWGRGRVPSRFNHYPKRQVRFNSKSKKLQSLNSAYHGGLESSGAFPPLLCQIVDLLQDTDQLLQGL